MAQPAKKRTYQSAIREEHAGRTRARILEAAGARFEAKGYGRTTIREIAEAAGVATDTVYAVFGNKARVLTALIDLRLAPGGGASVMERSETLAVRDERDQHRQIALFARDIARVSARVRPMYEIMRTAAAVEPQMATVYAEMNGYRLRNMQQLAAWLTANGPLRVDVERAGEIIWALASPEVARMLCDGQQWTGEQYAEWLEDSLVRVLLPDGPETPTARRRSR